ncbi:MAG: SHOCT domain-containing protein [Hyphomicrobiales bacterium]|nr:SHOCT domain-containing protein [Hyphomicrobiales bacterium]
MTPRGYCSKVFKRHVAVLSFAAVTAVVATPVPASAGGNAGVAFLGGLIGGHVLTDMRRESQERTRAMQSMAYDRPPAGYSNTVAAAPAPAPAPAAAPSATQSVESKLNTLDQLAAKGYISKEEYQRRRQAILDSM